MKFCVGSAYEQAVREQKVRTEISQAKRENSHFLRNVERGKQVAAIVQRKRKRGATEQEVCRACACLVLTSVSVSLSGFRMCMYIGGSQYTAQLQAEEGW